MIKVAALYVEPRGTYSNLEGVELWDERRDARLYAGFEAGAHQVNAPEAKVRE